jgi:hypothetical protein
MPFFFGGLAAFIFGIYDRHHFVPLSDRCTSGAGALGQALDQQVYKHCQMAETLASYSWWLIFGGLLATLLGVGEVLGMLGYSGMSLTNLIQRRRAG